jgi:uncharacterized membrane protein YbhN (UPF0104 family)
MTRGRKILVRLLVSGGLIAALLWLVDAREVFGIMLSASPALLLVVLALHTADRVLMGFKWWLLLEAEDLGVSLGEAVRAYYIASFAGLFLPMTVGADIVRTVTMRHAGQTTKIIATIGVERGIGALAQFALTGLSLLLIVQLDLDGAGTIDAATVGLLIGAIVIVLAASLPLSFLVARRVAVPWQQRGGMWGTLGGLAAAYAGYRHHRGTLWAFLGLTVLEGFLPVTIHFAGAWALGLPYSYVLFLATIPIAFLFARLPVSFGGIGVQEVGFVLLAGVVGIPADPATAIALMFQFSLVIALLPGAFAYLTSAGPADDNED